MSRLYYDKPFFRAASRELRRASFTSCAPSQKNVVASFRFGDVVVSLYGGNEVHVTERGSKTKVHERCTTAEVLKIIADAARAAEA